MRRPLEVRSTRRRTFDPRSIPGCVGWFDGNDPGAAYEEGDTVKFWRNKAGPGDLTSGWASWPTFRDNVRNGMSGMRFNGTSQGLGTATAPLATLVNGADVPVSVFAVFAQAGVASRQNICCWARHTNDVPFYEVQANFATNYLGANLRDDASATDNASLTVAPNTSWHVLAACNAGTAVDTTLDGTNTDLANAANVGTMTITRFALGVTPRLTPTNYFNGDIGEVIVYNRYLVEAERQLTERYLGKRWRVFV